MSKDTRQRFISSVSGLDEVLGGGLLAGGLYFVTGSPGTGKTVLANQLAFSCARQGGCCTYVTLLAESHSRMLANLETFAFFERSLLERHIVYLSASPAQREAGIDGLIELIEEEVHRRNPNLLVLDGIRPGSSSRGSPDAEYMPLFNRLAALLEFRNCTAIVNALSEAGTVVPEHALADGIIELTQTKRGVRALRELYVSKFRGSFSLEGKHVYQIDGRGITVYPRVEARLSREPREPRTRGERFGFGISGLDEMLQNGLPEASTTAVVGAPGTGKTLLGLHFLADGLKQGQRALYFGFYESPARILAQASGIGLPLSDYENSGVFDIRWHPPAEHLLDRLMDELLSHVRAHRIRRLYIDGLEGMARAVASPERVPSVLAATMNELSALDVTTLISVDADVLGTSCTPQWSAVFENTIVLKYVELQSRLHRLLLVVKVLDRDFDSSLRAFTISKHGIIVNDTFERAQAILSGMPRVQYPQPSAGDEHR